MTKFSTETPTSFVPIEGTGLAFTGERYVPSEHGEIRLEHIHRYAVALDIVADKDVLDIASGEGYGSFLLATVARSVTGVDISQEAVRHASRTYSRKNNLVFKRGSATKISLPDHSFDVVISFETIEHLAEQSKMLSEIRRVLKPSGVLLISSPNRPIYSEASGNHNEFHIKELDFSEFDSLLRKQFNAIRYLGQRMLIGSIVQPLDGAGSSLRALRDDGVNVQQTTGTLSDPVYFLALCGATEAIIPVIDASLMQPENLDLLKQYVGYAKWAISSNKELELLRKLHSDLNEEHHKVATWAQSLDKQNSAVIQALSEREQQIAMLSDETVKRDEWVLGLEAQLKTGHAEISQLMTERESHIVRLEQVAKELDEIRERYTQLDQEHQKVGSWAHLLDKQLSEAARVLSERENQISALSDDIAKQGEWANGLELQLNSTQAELTRAISERDNQIAHLNQSVAGLNDQIAKLDRDVLRTEYDLKLQEQSHLNDLKQNTLGFEQERIQLLVAQSDKEGKLGKEHADRERALHERLIAMQIELRKADQGWAEKIATHARLAAQEKTALQEEIADMYRQIQDFGREIVQRTYAQSEKEQALNEEHVQREHALNERLITMQVELRRADQEWAEKIAIHARLAAQEKTALQDEIADMHRQIQDASREKIQRAYAQSEKEHALNNEHAQREYALHERLVAMQMELRKADQDWQKDRRIQENLAACEKADLNNQIALLQQQIQELNREKIQLSASHAEQEVVRARESADREQSLCERLLAVQNELDRLGHEWAEKAEVQQSEFAKHQQSSTKLQEQLQDQIDAAKQVAVHWELTQNALQFELDAIKSSWMWRITTPLRQFLRWGIPVKQYKAASAQQYQTLNCANDNSTDAVMVNDHQDKTDRHFEDSGMTINSLAQANYTNTSIASLDELLDYHDEEFVWAAYQTLLRRAPDTEGMVYYMKRLKRGVGKLQVLDQIYRSNEAQARSINLPGLKNALRRNRWLNLPVIGAMLRRPSDNEKLNTLENKLLMLNESNWRRFDQIEKAVESLSQQILHQVQTSAGAATIQRLGYAHVDSWQTVDKLLSLEGSSFLESLFKIALGRHPEAKEFDHYIHVLDKGVSKLHIIELLFSCPECKTWLMQERATSTQPEPRIISQVVGDVEPKPLVAIAAESIHFVEYDEPLVSVVIPVYGKIEYTLMCLKSIQENLPSVEFEIIVVDDKSPDNTATELSKVSGIKCVLNSTNLGFIRSCNHGAEHAKGKYICFLNNDTEVMPGWLDELANTFRVFPGTGLVGSKFIYPNGTLQEAGGILWQDGSAWNFGRNQDPLLPIYNYAREVDYCSGASIIIPRALFNEFGGFDQHYLPAYCEDSDLALKVRDHGYRVIYQPLSVVVHYEGITSGTDTSHGAKAYQIENSKKLFVRWKDRLAHHQVNGVDVDKAKDRTSKQRVLVLDHCTPTPDQDAGSVTVFNLLLLLRDMGFQVTFIPEDNFLYMPEYTKQLQRVGVEVLYAPYYTSVEQHLVESGSRYELAFLFRPVVVERHLKTVRKYCPKTKVLYHTVDLHYLRMMREAKLLGDRAKQKAAEEMKLREFEAIRSVDASIVHSTSELDILRPELSNEDIHVFPLILNIRGTEKKFDERSGIVFVGGYQHAPNVDAVQYFVNEVMPHLRQRIPGVRFYAVGSKPPPEIFDLAADDVIITGFVEDLSPFLDKMRVSVAPLRYGAGIKGKIGTALAAGLPTVATILAAEGMSMTNGENILIAETPKDIAESITRLYNDESLWNQLQVNGIEFAESAWGAKAAWHTLQSILARMSIDISECKHALSLYE